METRNLSRAILLIRSLALLVVMAFAGCLGPIAVLVAFDGSGPERAGAAVSLVLMLAVLMGFIVVAFVFGRRLRGEIRGWLERFSELSAGHSRGTGLGIQSSLTHGIPTEVNVIHRSRGLLVWSVLNLLAAMRRPGTGRTARSQTTVTLAIASPSETTWHVGDRGPVVELLDGARIPVSDLPGPLGETLEALGCGVWSRDPRASEITDRLARPITHRRVQWLLEVTGEPTHIEAGNSGLTWMSNATPALTPETMIEVVKQMVQLGIETKPSTDVSPREHSVSTSAAQRTGYDPWRGVSAQSQSGL